MTDFDVVKHCVSNNMSVNYGKLTIADIRLSSSYKGTRRYQVYLESGNRFAENYNILDEAVTKFLELKSLVQPNVY